MKYFIGLILILMLSFSAVQAQSVQPFNVIQPDSITVLSFDEPMVAVDIPTVDFPPEAKIQVWWPEGETKYFMPNILEPNTSANEIRVLNGEKLKLKDNE